MNTKKLAQIKFDRKQRYFKFYSLGKYAHLTIENLRENKVYAQSLSNLNDPFEGWWYGCDTKLISSAHNREFSDRLDRCGIFSLCCSEEKYFPMSPKSILLWSHYSNGHKGFCIEFSDAILHLKDLEFSPSKVKYTDVLPDKNSTNSYDEYSSRDKETLLYCKGEMWSYENEMRLCFTKANDYVKIPRGCITAIYCGCKMSEEEIKIMRNLAKHLNAKFYVLEKATNGYCFKEPK